MKIKPLFDKVVLVNIKPQNEKKTSIILPDNLEEKPDIAEVYAVGEGGYIDGEHIKMVLKTGDKVLYNKFAGSEFNIENTTYTLIKQTDILAVID